MLARRTVPETAYVFDYKSLHHGDVSTGARSIAGRIEPLAKHECSTIVGRRRRDMREECLSEHWFTSPCTCPNCDRDLAARVRRTATEEITRRGEFAPISSLLGACPEFSASPDRATLIMGLGFRIA